MCVPQAIGVPGQAGPPTINGVVAGDLGWTNAFRYVSENGTLVPDAVMQTVTGGGKLYVSFEVNHDDQFTAYDAVVLTLETTATTSNYLRFHIFPFEAAPAANATDVTVPTSGADKRVFAWQGDGTTAGWTTSIPVPANVVVKRANSFALVDSSWSIEIELPIAGLSLAPVNYFGLYASVFKVTSSGTPSDDSDDVWSESRWPSTATLTANPFLNLETATPPQTQWGNATFGGATCNGVYFSPSDIATNQASQYTISLNHPNNFTVNVHNSSLNATGTPVAAGGVTAVFKIADFGLPATQQWHLVPADGSIGPNPTAAASVPASGTTPMTTGAWSLSATEQTHFAPPNEHQCVLVELDSKNVNTTFLNRSTWTNMHFQTTSSPFESRATIGTKGYRLPEGRRAHEFLLTEHTYNTERDETWASQLGGLVKKADGLYTLAVEPESEARIKTVVTPPSIVIPSRDVAVKPGAGAPGAQPLRLPVREGDFVTLIAEGALKPRRQSETVVGPSGVPLNPTRDWGHDERADTQKYLLGPASSPSRLVGALVGSWDGFRKSAFLVGAASSFKVPAGVEALQLAINDTPDGYSQQSGAGFQVQAIVTPGKPIYTVGRSIGTRDPAFEDLHLPIGMNVPSWVMCGYRRTGQKMQIRDKAFERADSVGCFGYMVRKIGGGR